MVGNEVAGLAGIVVDAAVASYLGHEASACLVAAAAVVVVVVAFSPY